MLCSAAHKIRFARGSAQYPSSNWKKGGGGADASANKSESRLGNCCIRAKMIRPRGWRSLRSNELSEDCRSSWMKQGAAIRCDAVRMLQIGNGKYVAGNKRWMSDR
jgi:hypothetical protein